MSMSNDSSGLKSALLKNSALLYSAVRSAQFTAEYLGLQALTRGVEVLTPPKTPRQATERDPLLLREVIRELSRLLERDAQAIADGVYPPQVLLPESPVEHFLRVPRLYSDGVALHLRRLRGRTTEFSPDASRWLNELPRYFRRNFHFQTDGYLSERSAELYEHQVEMLFHGGADAMRRPIIRGLRERFGSQDGEGLRFLEVGAGTGRATRFVRLAFPKAKIMVTDLSEPYLKTAQKRLSHFDHLDFAQADGGALPFSDGHFDAVYSVFLFHELPFAERVKTVSEAARVLKKKGVFAFVDSIQLGDRREFDALLGVFPREFHEPFYRDYVARPMSGLLTEARFQNIQADYGFMSKLGWGFK